MRRGCEISEIPCGRLSTAVASLDDHHQRFPPRTVVLSSLPFSLDLEFHAVFLPFSLLSRTRSDDRDIERAESGRANSDFNDAALHRDRNKGGRF